MPDEPVDDAVLVNEPMTEEESNDKLVADVTKMLHPEEVSEEAPEETPDTESEKPGEEPEMTVPEDEGEMDEGLKSRIKGAGLPEDLAQRLHQSGQLEETLAAFDRRMIDHVQSKQEKPAKDEKPKEKESDDQEVPALDPEVYDEALIKRDAYQQQRIDALESQLEQLMTQAQSGFDEWFDGALAKQGVDTNDDDKCQAVYQAYTAICDAFGKPPGVKDEAMVQRAYAAMFPQDVFKQKQRQTVDRLRDAQGKFLSQPPAKKAPPSKQASDEEVHENLVANVSAYLKEQGVQMSGY